MAPPSKHIRVLTLLVDFRYKTSMLLKPLRQLGSFWHRALGLLLLASHLGPSPLARLHSPLHHRVYLHQLVLLRKAGRVVGRQATGILVSIHQLQVGRTRRHWCRRLYEATDVILRGLVFRPVVRVYWSGVRDRVHVCKLGALISHIN